MFLGYQDKCPRIGLKLTLDWHLIGLEDFHGIAVGSMSSSVETLGFANWELCAMIHPPSRLGTIPYRGLVPRLEAQLSSEYPGLARLEANAVPIHFQLECICQRLFH